MEKEETENRVMKESVCKYCRRIFKGFTEKQVANNRAIHEMNCELNNEVAKNA